MTGYESPKYTGVPNEFLDEQIKTMGFAEMKIMLCIFRQTFGWHRTRFTMTIKELARASGLTPRNAWAGAEQAERDGLIRRHTSQGIKSEWELLVAEDHPLMSQGIKTLSPGTANPGLKKEKSYHLRDGKKKRSPLDKLRSFLEEAGQ